MESLYRKYRPLTFDSVVGQQHIVSTLEHAITEGRLSHAYLFCGPRGTGKTTMARILAKALLCKNADAARAEGASGCMPDGTCEECELIAEGNHPDVYELDAASRTGVDNVREEIINSVNFAPVRGKYKIYIIDEVHMLTTAAFNALLKTLEEPPEHVIFVLCTTDPQKILETILSRCQRFDFHRIGNEDIERRLAYVCEQEGFDFDNEALEIVARHARGGMRDALSTLEQLSVFGNGSVHVDDARSLLGEASGEVLGEFARAIAERDVAALFGMVRSQVEEGNDLLELTRDLVAHVRDVYMACVAGARAELFDGGAAEAEALAAEAAAFGEHPADRLARTLTVLDDAALEMRNASDARLVLEIACTRLARPESDLTLEALAERLDRLEAMVANGAVPAGVVAAAAGAHAAAASAAGAAPAAGGASRASAAPATAAPSRSSASFQAPAAAAQHAPASTPGNLPWDANKGAAGVVESRTSTASVAAAAPAQSAAPAQPAAPARPVAQPVASARPAAPAQPVSSAPKPELTNAAKVAAAGAAETPAVEDAGELQRKWEEVVERVKKAQPSRAGLLLRARAQADDGSKLTVGFPAGSAFSIKMLGRADTQSIVLPIVCAVFGRRTVEYVMDGGAAAAPRQEEPSPAARAAASADPRPVPTAAPAPSSPAAPPSETEPGPSAASGSNATSTPRSSASFQEPSHAEGSTASHVPAQTPSAAAASSTGQLESRTSTQGVAAAGAVGGALTPGHVNPAPAQVPKPAAPKPKPAAANEAAKAPWLRSDNPAGAPATGHLPTAPAPRAPERGKAAGPKPAPVQTPPWESEQVPYDDASIGGYVAGGEDDLPPFDVPGAPAAPASAVAPTTASAPAPVSATASASAPAPVATPVSASAAPAPAQPAPSDAVPAVPWESNPGAGSPFGHQGAAPSIPQTEEEAKALIRSVFGQATIFKPVE